jgi:hypothetical protein
VYHEHLSPEDKEARLDHDYCTQYSLIDPSCARVPVGDEPWWPEEFDIYTLWDLVNE